jgi:hypothetical protein
MSFLDNLENNLKSLESQEETSENRVREQRRRESERALGVAAAPWADKLKHSAYTENLLKQATLAGHKLRAKVYISWIGSILRLEARGKKLELRPTATGILAVFLENQAELDSQLLDLEGTPEGLVDKFLSLE